MSLLKKSLCALLLAAALVRPASADSYSFTQLTSGGSVPSVATLSITDVSGGALFALTGTFGWLPASAFLSHLWFNGPSGTVAAIGGNTFKAQPTYGSTTNASYQFTWDATYPTAGNPGSDRFLATDTSTWQILGAGITAASFSLPMMVHIQGLEGNTLGLDSSIKVLSPVPEPSTYAMLLAGLGLLGFMARRRLYRFGHRGGVAG